MNKMNEGEEEEDKEAKRRKEVQGACVIFPSSVLPTLVQRFSVVVHVILIFDEGYISMSKQSLDKRPLPFCIAIETLPSNIGL